MVGEGMGSDVGTNPALVEKYTQAVRRGTNLPILAKMTPNITDITIPAVAAINAKADGIAAINTIKCLTGIDLDEMCAKPSINGKCAVSGYSGKAVKPVALRFISDLAGCRDLFGVPLSGIGGIENWQDALEFIALGCSIIQVTTAVMQYGYRIIEDMTDGTKRFLSEHGFKSIKEIIGLASRNIVSADELDRETAEFPVFNRKQCLGCGRCVISCADGGHKALVLDEARKPKMAALLDQQIIKASAIITVPFHIHPSCLFAYDGTAKSQAVMEKNVYIGYLASAEVRSVSEKKFERFCETCDAVDWVYKNGDKGAEYFPLCIWTALASRSLFSRTM